MLQFNIQSNSDLPASQQLLDQIQFAIASRQFPAGQRLPSLRQLEMITGLHRNTISKVYRQLEEQGLVESIAGSGIYIKENRSTEIVTTGKSPLLTQYPKASELIGKTIDQLLDQGCTLSQARELFMAEIDWRLRCGAQVVITVPAQDIGAGELMAQELEQAIALPVQLVPLEELDGVLAQTHSGTVLTTHYFVQEAEKIAKPKGIRVLPVDLYDYADELKLIKGLAQGHNLGIVSLSPGILRVAEIIIFSLRADEIFVFTAQAGDRRRLNALVRSSQTIICDPASTPLVEQAIQAARDDLIRKPTIVTCRNYISEQSIDLLRRELDMV
jgi:GntR family transcriptional regulator